MTFRPKSMIRLFITALAGACASGGVPDAGELTPQRNRITDEAIARDLGLFDAWRHRLEQVGESTDPSLQYHRAKAEAWLVFGRGEYEVNDRTGVAEAAFGEATRLIARLEGGETPRVSETPVLVGSVRLREDLWDVAERLKDGPGFRCAAAAIARLEVQLVWAGNEQLTCGTHDAHEHLATAEATAREAQRLAADCAPLPGAHPVVQPSVTVRTVPRASLAIALAPPSVPERLVVPNVIHFAFDRSDISANSAAVLDRIAAVVREYPDLRVVMFGHTDRRGSDTYNYALARRRAEAARAYLLSREIDPIQLRVVSEGKARLLRGGVSLVDHAHNRRVEFDFYTSVGRRVETVLQDGDLQVEEPRPRQ